MNKDFATQSVHFDRIEQNNIQSKVTPIYETSAFTFENLNDLENYFQGEDGRKYLYSRSGNPNTDEFGQAVAQLENAPAGVAASSGLGVILTGILSVVKSGSHIIAANDLYGGTVDLLQTELSDLGIEVSFVDFSDQSKITQAIKENTVLLYSESITNPLLRVEDLRGLVGIAKNHNLITMVDNTFATPYLIQPYTLGVDLVVHSATKYLGGHSDVTAGVVAGSKDIMEKVKRKVTVLGTTLSPFEAWLAVRGIKTLDVRMERHVNNAQKVAETLRDKQAVQTVYFPNEVSEKGNGAIVTAEFSEQVDIETFFEALDWIKIIPTLAGVETTVSYPKSTSHRSLDEDRRNSLGITKNLVRISIGLEKAEDIIGELNRAIDKATT